MSPAVTLDWPSGVAVVASDAAGTECFDVPVDSWLACVAAAKAAGFDYLDWLTGVDELDREGEPPAGVDVVVHLVRLPAPSPAVSVTVLPGVPVASPSAVAPGRGVERLLLRTRVPLIATGTVTSDAASTATEPGGTLTIDSITGLFAGAAWHERETFEMFGVEFDGFDDGSGAGLRPLLLPDGFSGTPLRKSFQLAARAAKPWPGAKEPGEGGEAAPSRRKSLPPGVPDPMTWGPRDGGGTVGGVG